MKYISICSGIEAATVAWHGMAWQPLAFSEIEAFPSAVLAHHYPNVPNLGDMTKFREWPEEILAECELLVGGPPCQAFSVAGLRRSLDDDRGNITLAYVHLLNHIDEVRRRHGRPPVIAVYENVPGLLSTKDNAFGCLIGALCGCDEAPETETGKWPKAGFFCGETRRVGYRVLDAQYFGVAQRRRRVFLVAVPCELVASLGERACPSEILSLRDSVLGNPPTRGAAWEGTSRTTASGLTGSGRGVERCGESRGQDDVVIDCASVAGTLNANAKAAGSATSQDAEVGLLVASEREREHPAVARTVTARIHKGFDSTMDSQTPIVTRGSVFEDTIAFKTGQSEAAGGTFVTEGFSPTVQAQNNGSTAVPAVAFKPSHFTRGKDGAPSAVTPPLSADADKGDQDIVCFHPTQDPISSVDGSAHSIRTGSGGGCATHAVCVTPAVVNMGGDKGGASVSTDGSCFTLSTNEPHAVQKAMAVRRLTPIECACLQGFPADYLDITFRKKPAADGPKYRALGNSMAVPCMWWLGKRIQEATQPPP